MNISPSYPRRRESSDVPALDARLRGRDGRNRSQLEDGLPRFARSDGSGVLPILGVMTRGFMDRVVRQPLVKAKG